jgi:hypothetical protein
MSHYILCVAVASSCAFLFCAAVEVRRGRAYVESWIPLLCGVVATTYNAGTHTVGGHGFDLCSRCLRKHKACTQPPVLPARSQRTDVLMQTGCSAVLMQLLAEVALQPAAMFVRVEVNPKLLGLHGHHMDWAHRRHQTMATLRTSLWAGTAALRTDMYRLIMHSGYSLRLQCSSSQAI